MNTDHTGEHALPRRRSRFPEPGTMASAWWEADVDGRYRFVNLDVAVLATSAHRRRLTDDEALTLLREAHGPDTSIGRIGTWRSVTQRDMEWGEVGDSTPGDWNEAGSGTRWVDIAYPDEATVRAYIGRNDPQEIS